MSDIKTLDELIEALGDIIDEAGISIKFGDKNRVQDPLTGIIAEAIKQANSQGNGKEVGAMAQAVADAVAEKLAETLNPTAGSLKAIEQSNKNQENTLDRLEEQGKKWYEMTDSQKRRIIETGFEIALNSAKSAWGATKDKFTWLKELESSGVRLVGGFENSFTQLANDAKMSHDTFTQMLVANSKQVAKMNALGSETMSSMMKASGDLVGKFGYNADEASKIMLHYMNTVDSATLAEQTRNGSLTKEVEALGKQMKSLSLATGKSVELLLQEQEQKRNNLLMEKIYRDPAMRELMQMGTAAGISDEVMLAAITGRPNEKSSRMNITEGGRTINRTLTQIAMGLRSGSMSKADIAPMLAAAQNDPRVLADVQALRRMSYGLAGAISSEAAGETIFDVSQFERNRINPNASNMVGKGATEEKALNSLSNLITEKNKLLNTHTDKLAFSLTTASDVLDDFSSKLADLNDILNSKLVPDWLYGLGVGVVMTGLQSKAFRGYLANTVLDKVWNIFLHPIQTTTKVFDFVSGKYKGFKTATANFLTSFQKTNFSVKNFGKLFEKFNFSFGSFKKSFGKFSLNFKNLSPKVLGGLKGLGVALFNILEEVGTSLLGKKDKNSFGYKFGDTALKALSWGIQGFLLGGPYGALAGAIAGLGYGIWKNWFGSDDDESSESIDSGSYPAQNNIYNTSNNTQINTTRESAQMRTNDLAKDVKKIANNSDELQRQRKLQEKAQEDSRLASRSALVTVGYC